MWRLRAITAEPSDFDSQVAEVLARLTQDLAAWKRLTAKCKADLLCGWFMAEPNEGEDLSAATLLALGSRGVSLALDIYGPERDV